MNTFVNAVNSNLGSTLTENGMPTFETSGSKVVDMFFQAGSARRMSDVDVASLFLKALGDNKDLAIRCLLWLRDARGGAGERKTFRTMLRVAYNHLSREDFMLVLERIPDLGRWDDFFGVLEYENLDVAVEFAIYVILKKALEKNDRLLAKWLPRQGALAAKIRNALGYSPKTWRKMLVAKTHVVETPMCAKEWSLINYESVPSVAHSRYKKAFAKRDTQRYIDYLNSVQKGEKKINASAVFPHDVIRDASNTKATIAQWNALPNYLGDSGFILPMVDVSGSMVTPISGGVTALDVAIGLGLYLADKQSGPFKDMTLTFSGESRIEVLKGDIVSKMNQLRHQHWGMNTDLERAFGAILDVAVSNKVSQEDMPKTLVILSDMQFDQCVRGADESAYTMIRSRYARAGYDVPRVVFWNLNARANQSPVSFKQNGTALISGYSPAIMKSVLCGENITPEKIMLDTIMKDRYNWNS